MRKLVMAATAIAVMTGVATAENARTQSLVNSPLFKDRNDVSTNPAWSAEYRKFIEIDYTNSTQAPGKNDVNDVAHLLGVMPIGDAFSVGTYVSGSETALKPHLILGMKLGDVKLGLQGYVEKYLDTSYTETSEGSTSNGTGSFSEKEEIENSADSLKIGFKLGAVLPLGDGELEVLGGFGGRPFSEETYRKYTSNDGTNTTDTTSETIRESVGNINYVVGAEVRLPHNDNEFIVGLGVEGSKTEFETTAKTTDKNQDDGTITVDAELSNINKMFSIGAEAGYKFNLSKGFSFAIADQFAWTKYKEEPQIGKDTSGTTITNTVTDEAADIYLDHYFTLAGEKEFGKSRLFDKHYFRLGLGYDVSTHINRNDYEASVSDTDDSDIKGKGTYEDRTKETTTFTDLDGTAGFGFERGRFQFDLFVGDVNFDWSDSQAGILNLFGFAGATATIDFGKEGSVLRRNDPEWEM